MLSYDPLRSCGEFRVSRGVQAKTSVPPKIKFPVHSHEYILQKVFKMTGVILKIARLSLIDIYWY